ncbi:PA1571 family protein [Porticoccus sp. GXU_MW_L64]
MTQKDKLPFPPEADFHGAAIIGEDGKEIPITEEMVESACEKMDKPQTQACDGE